MKSQSNNTRTYKFMSGAVVTIRNKEVTDDRGVFLGYESTMNLKYALGFGSEPMEFESPDAIANIVRKIKFEDDQLPLDSAIDQLNSAGVVISNDTNFNEPAEEDRGEE